MEETHGYIEGLAADVGLLAYLWIARLIVWRETRRGPKPSGGVKDLASLK